MSKISEILTGWGHLIKDRFDALDPEIKALSEDRLQACNVCNLRTGTICDPRRVEPHLVTGNLTKGCGCNIAAKSLSPGSKCPLGKWYI
jgi:hypothetical protein